MTTSHLRTLLSILGTLNSAIVRMVSIRPSIFDSSSPLSKPGGTVTSLQIIISITVTLMFHCFLSSRARSKNLSLFSLFISLFNFLLRSVSYNPLPGVLLHIDLRPGQTYHPKVMHRKEVTHSDGSYGKKSHRQAWLTTWDKVKSHATVIDWCTGRE